MLAIEPFPNLSEGLKQVVRLLTLAALILVSLTLVRCSGNDAQPVETPQKLVPKGYLKASNTGTGDWFGSSVAVSGDTLVVGARFEDSNATGVDGNQADNSATGQWRGLRFRTHGRDLEPAGLSQGLQHRGG